MLIQKLRLQRGWSQQQLAELSGLSTRTIQRVENGAPASMETLKSLASVFEIDYLQLSSEVNMNSSATINSAAAMSGGPLDASGMDTGAKPSAEERLAFRHVRKLKAFYFKLFLFPVIIAILAAINLTITPHKLWFIWPALVLALILLIHAIRLFSPFFGPDWEKRQVEKRLGRPL